MAGLSHDELRAGWFIIITSVHDELRADWFIIITSAHDELRAWNGIDLVGMRS